MEQWMEYIKDWLAMYGLKIVAAIAIFIIGRIVVGILAGVMRRILKKASTDETLARFAVGLIPVSC